MRPRLRSRRTARPTDRPTDATNQQGGEDATSELGCRSGCDGHRAWHHGRRPGPGARGHAYGASLHRPHGADPRQVRRALGAPDRGAVGRPHQGRDLSFDGARRRTARALRPGARRRRRHRLDPARLHARCVPALRGVRAADRASRQRGGDLARNPGRVRSDRAGLRGRAPDPDLRACRPGAPYGRQADPQGRGSRRAEAAHPVAHRRDADRGLGRAAGRHAGARAAAGAVEERGRRRAGALRDRAAAQGP